MRYISKGDTPAVLSDWIAQQQPVGFDLTYDAFPETGPLKRLLIEEQFGLCGYTGQRITASDSHIEHLKPQKECNAEIERRGGLIGHELGDDLNYHNMIAARTIGGKKPYGATEKGDWYDPILFVSPLDADCATHFTFSLDGAISGVDLAGSTTVEKLKLGHPILTDMRRGTLTAFFDPELLDQTYLESLVSLMEPAIGLASELPEFSFVIQAIAIDLLRAAS